MFEHLALTKLAAATVSAMPALATEAVVEATDEIAFGTLIIGLLGGLAIFLFGMDQMTDGLKVVAGERLRTILQRLTANRWAGMATGAGVTAVIQSSSVTTVLVVGFITSGLMTLEQSLGVIMGANIGTTVTAQIVSLNVTKYALLMVAAGFGMTFVAKRSHRAAQGAVVMGLGLVFFGMVVMGDAMAPLRTYPPFIDAMATMERPLIGIVTAAVFTALVQSSSATTGIVIVLASQGLVSPEAGIALILGANVGTSATALLAAIGKPREALRAAVAHTFFNVVGVLLWVFFIDQLAAFVGFLGGGTAREIANAHTTFNLVNAFLFIGFTGQIARMVERLVPDRSAADEAKIKVKYLDKSLLDTPPLALDRARLELLRMADRVRAMLAEILPAILTGTRDDLVAIQRADDEVDELHGYIIRYLGHIGQNPMTEVSSEELVNLMEATNNLEAIGDLIETNLVSLGFARIEEGLRVSLPTRNVLQEYLSTVQEALDFAMVALTQKNESAAQQVEAMKKEVKSLERAASLHEAERLMVDAPNRVALYRFEVDVLANLKRIFYFSRRIARLAIPSDQRSSL